MYTSNYAYFYGELISFPLCYISNVSRLQVLWAESKRFNSYVVVKWKFPKWTSNTILIICRLHTNVSLSLFNDIQPLTVKLGWVWKDWHAI